jgi:hypothetical protein
MLIQEYLMAILDQPQMHLTGQRQILAGVTDEHPGHSTPPHHRRSHPPWRLGVCASTPAASVARSVLKKARRGCRIHPNPATPRTRSAEGVAVVGRRAH